MAKPTLRTEELVEQLRSVRDYLGDGNPAGANVVDEAIRRLELGVIGNPYSAELRRQFGAMPYGGLCNFLSLSRSTSLEELNLNTVTTDLERLTEVLARIGADNEAERTELLELRRDRDALRRVLGITPLLEGMARQLADRDEASLARTAAAEADHA